MAKHSFNAQTSQVLDLVIHSLYSNKEIFLRELISNSSDALEKLNYLVLTDEKFKELSFEPKIKIEIDKENKVLSILDNGIGMNDEDLQENLGTIAKSGTKKFLESVSKDKDKNSELIGQFGVGFYSAFMVANKIEVITKKAGEEKAFKWISDGSDVYEIVQESKETQGTAVKLYLKEEEGEFLSEHTIESIIKKFANHIPHKIVMDKEKSEEVEKEEGKKETVKSIEEEQINLASALWKKSKSEVKKEDYNEFYKTTFHDYADPDHNIHTNAEGTLEYSTLFFIPSNPPADLYRADFQPGVKLYVKRVFITDKEKELLPMYLRFVRGIIDAEDLPLNVSREILQQNIILTKIVKASVKKVLSELGKIKKKDGEKYNKIWANFGKVLKEGLLSDFDNKDTILDLAMFKSSKSDELVSLKQYKENMKENQKAIYYITGQNESVLKNSPLIEKFKANDIEVLLLDDEIDPIIMPGITKYDETDIKAVGSVDINEELGLEKEDESQNEEAKKANDELTTKIKDILKESVKDVKVSTHLSDSPACIVFDTTDPMYQTQQMMKQMGQDTGMEIPPVLEINPKHDIFNKLSSNDEQLDDVAHVILDQAKLIEGLELKDPIAFSKRLNNIISKAV
jgi:molecular chaperone HtpG